MTHDFECWHQKTDELFDNETELADDYPVHPSFAYVIEMDDASLFVIISDIGGTVTDLKRDTKAKTIYRCSIVQRQNV